MVRYEEQAARKTLATIHLIKRHHSPNPTRILVVGCGDGAEAGIFARCFLSETIGIDVDETSFDRAGSLPATLVRMDAGRLAFVENSFDLIYSFHALEHISDARKALSEMSRVLRPNGAYLIGTPNRTRLIGYVGSPVPLRSKLRWNVADWSMRLRGRWSNEAGAHAGFSACELNDLCRAAFGQAQNLEQEYYLQLYAAKARMLRAVLRSGTQAVLFPCVYVFGTKSA